MLTVSNRLERNAQRDDCFVAGPMDLLNPVQQDGAALISHRGLGAQFHASADGGRVDFD